MSFFVVVSIFLVLSYSYCGWRLFAGMRWTRRRIVLIAGGVVIALALTFWGGSLRFNAELADAGRPITVFAFLLAGAVTVLLPFLLARDVLYVGLVLKQWWKKRSNHTEPAAGNDLNRRRLFLRYTGALSGGLAATSVGIGVHQATRMARLEHVAVPIPDLHPDLQGLKIIQLSDIHVGPTVRRDYVAEVVKRVSEIPADIIAITGDLVDGRVQVHADEVEPLKDLSAPLGTYFVTGNHEYYAGVEDWLDVIDRLGIDILLNEHRTVTKGGASLNVVGITDQRAGQQLASHRCDPDKAVFGTPTADANLLLAHRPWSAVDAEHLNFDLMLCGHTHGGQYFPWNFWIDMFHPHVRGLNRHRPKAGKDFWVYVSRGTGYWGPPIRTGVPMEITLLELGAA